MMKVHQSDGFHPGSSHFFAPYAGMYLFTAQIHGNNIATAQLVVQGVPMATFRAHYGMSSATVVVDLVNLERVYVQLRGDVDDKYAYCHENGTACTFSGVLLETDAVAETETIHLV